MDAHEPVPGRVVAEILFSLISTRAPVNSFLFSGAAVMARRLVLAPVCLKGECFGLNSGRSQIMNVKDTRQVTGKFVHRDPGKDGLSKQSALIQFGKFITSAVGIQAFNCHRLELENVAKRKAHVTP
ncbi:hypothetical protein KOW79_002846 [Hemibagrus wyckioides]|uniref:Uncharacterized protein n=1 Tax=Hemibagrus wyckioides TaxID=337641 RepID=A0A9D3P6G2_9TELE|nr:hypothetical protein KOW79_002846 [Hemibagrus wyckioides]